MAIEKSNPVPPFVSYCATLIPTVFDNSLSYYEALSALAKWLQDNVVDVINNNATVTEEYAKLVEELQSYVENYFENLDVQEEINNKLDEMTADGTLEEIIGHYITNDFVTKTTYATAEVGGAVKVGETLEISADGVLDVAESVDYIPMEFKTVRYQGTGGYSTVHYAKIEAGNYPKLTLANDTINTVQLGGDNALDNKSTFAVNAGRFNVETSATAGVIIVDGEIKKQNDSTVSGNEILYMTSDGILHSVTYTTTANQLLALGAVWAVEAWYPFIKEGADLTGSRDPSDYQPRSIIAQDAEGNYLVFVCGGRSYAEAGMSAVDCKNFASSLSFVPVFMYNLDGGASTNFIEHGQRMNSLVDNTDRPVANFISWISSTAKDNGVFKSANTSDHKSLQNMRASRPMNIKSQISFGTNVADSLNTTVLALGNMIVANIDVTVSATLSAYDNVVTGLPHNATSDSHFVFRKTDSDDTADLYINNFGALRVGGSNTLGAGRWFGTVIYSTDSGRTQSSNPE